MRLLSVDSQRFSARVHSENRRRAAVETTEEELRSAERPEGGSLVKSLSLMSEDGSSDVCLAFMCRNSCCPSDLQTGRNSRRRLFLLFLPHRLQHENVNISFPSVKR